MSSFQVENFKNYLNKGLMKELTILETENAKRDRERDRNLDKEEGKVVLSWPTIFGQLKRSINFGRVSLLKHGPHGGKPHEHKEHQTSDY